MKLNLMIRSDLSWASNKGYVVKRANSKQLNHRGGMTSAGKSSKSAFHIILDDQ